MHKIACLEEIAFNRGWLDLSSLEEAGRRFGKSGYGQYLLRLVKEQKGML